MVAAEVTDEATDYHQLHPMIAAANQTLAAAGIDIPIGQLLADAGYCSEDNLANLDEDDPDCFIATRNSYRNPKSRNGSRGPLPADATLVDRMDRTVTTKSGRAVYRKRQHMIEPVFGQSTMLAVSAGSRAAARPPPTVNGSCWRPPTTC